MKPTDKIEQLKKEIQREQSKIENCDHDFGEPFYNAKMVMEGYGMVQDGAGSDPHCSYEGYREVPKDRWTRKCKLCGFEEHTKNLKPIIKGHKPDFGD